MKVIMEYKLDENADTIIWFSKEKDGEPIVMLETGGFWKQPGGVKDAILDIDPHILFNSQTNVTDSRLGDLALSEWRATGSPTFEKLPKATGKYFANMPWAPPCVLAYYRTKMDSLQPLQPAESVEKLEAENFNRSQMAGFLFLHDDCVVSTPRKGRCPEIAMHEDADGEKFCDEHWSQHQRAAEDCG